MQTGNTKSEQPGLERLNGRLQILSHGSQYISRSLLKRMIAAELPGPFLESPSWPVSSRCGADEVK